MNIYLLIYTLIGTIVGLFMGALPGLTVTMTMTLVVSLTFGWDMGSALAFILGAFCGGVLGGSLSAITLNIPGTAAAVATTFDGFPLKKKGEAARAINISLFVSFLGGIFGLLFLLTVGPLLGDIALKFGSQENFLITLWGLSLIAILSKGTLIKGIISGCIGLFIAMIGMDPMTGIMRFSFNNNILSGGIHYVVAMIGLFGMKEVLINLESNIGFQLQKNEKYKIRDLLPDFNFYKKIKILKPLIWSAPIGAIIGLIPGTGGDIGSLVAYGTTKSLIKNPKVPFGEGAYEGVAAPEIANDSAIGGALTTLLTLGIPGDSVTAVILASFYLHGLLPGPTFMMTERGYFYLIIKLMAVGIIFSYFFGIMGSNLMLKALSLPRWFLFPTISILCVVGTFALQNNLYHVYFMLFFGILGYLFEKSGYPVSPTILGIILGPLIEMNFRRALINTGSMSKLLISFVTRPLSLIIIIVVISSFILQIKVLHSYEGK